MAAMVAILDFRILAIFIYKLPQYFLPSFKSTDLSVQENKYKIAF